MKAKGLTESFNPVTVEVTFESEEELNAFYALINFAPFNDTLGIVDFWGPIRRAIREANEVMPKYDKHFEMLSKKY